MKSLLSTWLAAALFVGASINPSRGYDEKLEFIEHETAQAAKINLLTAEKVLFATDQALDAAAVIASNIDNGRLVHGELRRLADRLPGVRAIIAVGRDGMLVHDSYSYPAAGLDLSDRTYFRRALVQDGMIVGQKVIGRQSGSAFVPLAKRIGDLTFIAVTSPFALIDIQTDCADCWSAATTASGDAVVVFPPETNVPRQFLRTPATQAGDIGSRVVRYKNSVVLVSWRKSAEFPIISMSIRGLPESTAVDIDMN